MPKTIYDLKKLWEKEKLEYKTQEVGSGVQKFVKELLRCEEVFNLKDGNLSTSEERRCNEFLEEKSRKSKRADIIIYVDNDRIIPVEVEKYGNIQVGEKQLFNYQLVWNKKYGILTDGFEWRFYNNNIPIKIFKVYDIFEEKDEFLEFWNEYILPENYYLSFFEKIGQLELFEKDISLDAKREEFFTDITTLINSFRNKLNIKGYFDNLGHEESGKKSVEITYAYIIQFILFKTLVDNSFGDFEKDFEDRIETIHNSLKNGSYKQILRTIQGISNIISKNVYRPFSKEQEFINKTLESILDKPTNDLTDVTPWLDIFIFIKRYSFANVKNEIFGYIYENYLKDIYLDEQKGQYFTDPSIVNFMLKQVGYTSREIRRRLSENNDSISLIDPSCGSGTFLYGATNEIIKAIPNGSMGASSLIERTVNNNIFGLDIAEFPLYLAEMNIIMRMLPLIINESYNNPIEKKIKVFKTKDSISEFLDTVLGNTMHDENLKYDQMGLFRTTLDLGYNSYMREESDLENMKKSLENQPRIQRYRFDFVVGNPPYISYNESSKQHILFFECIKARQVKLNNVYGMNLHSVPENPKRYRPNPNLWAFFIALGITLLKDNGKLCYIIPQTLLINADFDVVRFHLSKFTTIEKIITFSGKMFIGRGIKQNKPIPTSSLIIVISRKRPEENHEVEIYHYEDSADDIDKCLSNIERNIKTLKKSIRQDFFLKNINNWNFIKVKNEITTFLEEYRSKTDQMTYYSEHYLARARYNDEFYFDGGYSIDEKKFLSSPADEMLHYKRPKLNEKYWTIKEFEGFWPNVRESSKSMFIELRQGNQGYKFLDHKYKIIWSYNNTTKFFYTDDDIIWARNTFLGISSNSRDEILYLFALLNSKVTQYFLSNIVKIDNEDTRTILVSLQILKDQIRIPKISELNQFLKNQIIRSVDNLLKAEETTIADLVDLSNIRLQKIDDFTIEKDFLVLQKGSDKIRCKIKNKFDLVSKILLDQKMYLFSGSRIKLSQLKNLLAIDTDYQLELKSYIDDLIFALYFDVVIKKMDIDKYKKIREACKRNKYYSLISEQ